MLPKYDHKKLEELLGEKFPELESEEERIAVRVILDFLQAEKSKDKISNAVYWIRDTKNYSYQTGYKHGEEDFKKILIRRLGLE